MDLNSLNNQKMKGLDALMGELSTIQIPAMIREYIMKQSYWKQSIPAVWYVVDNNIAEEQRKNYSYATSLQITIKADNSGFYIDECKVFEWKNESKETDTLVIYPIDSDNDIHLCFSSDENGRIGISNFASYLGYIESDPNVVSDFASKRDAAKLDILEHYMKEFCYWGKWTPVKVDHYNFEKTYLSKSGIGQMIVKQDGLYLEFEKIFSLSELNIVSIGADEIKCSKKIIKPWLKESNPPIFIFISKDRICTTSDIYCSINDVDDSVIHFVYCFPAIKSQYKKLTIAHAKDCVDDKWVKTKELNEMMGWKQVSIEMSANPGSNSISIHLEIEDGKLDDDGTIHRIKQPWGFEKYPSALVLSNGEITFHKCFFLPIVNSRYSYKINIKQLHQICRSESAKWKLVGDNTTKTINVDGIKKLARAIEEEFYNFPSHYIKYLDSDIAYSQKEYDKALVLIQESLKDQPENIYYLKLLSSIEKEIKERGQIKAEEADNNKTTVCHSVQQKEECNKETERKKEESAPTKKQELKPNKKKWIIWTLIALVFLIIGLTTNDDEPNSQSVIEEQVEMNTPENEVIDQVSQAAPSSESDIDQVEKTEDYSSEELYPEINDEVPYRSFVGTINNKYEISVSIYGGRDGYSGKYYYKSQGPEHLLYLVSDSDCVVFSEYNSDDKLCGTFYIKEGIISTYDDNIIRGIYIREKDGMEMPFEWIDCSFLEEASTPTDMN